MKKQKPRARKNPYQLITDRIIELLESGTVPWQKPWHDAGPPKNLNSGKAYRGVNPFVLNCEAAVRGYSTNYWLTFKQCQARGGKVRKGEKGTPVVFWKIWEKEVEESSDQNDDEEKIAKIPVLKFFYVFNAEQCDGIDVPQPDFKPLDFNPITECERTINEMPNPPTIRHGETRAYYSPPRDLINLPEPEAFISTEEYYSTLFHEVIHSTGHESRLNRPGITDSTQFGSEVYGREELVAEMGAAFLCGQTGIAPAIEDNSAAYIQGWLSKLRTDHKAVVIAASQAQKAVDYVTGHERIRVQQNVQNAVYSAWQRQR